jgi:hypothetical protein
MKLVQLSPKSIERLMTRPESLPLSLHDLLSAIPMDWREQSFGMSKKSAQRARQFFNLPTPQAANGLLGPFRCGRCRVQAGSCNNRRVKFLQPHCTLKGNC